MSQPLTPCKTCPWRRTTKTEDIPGGGMCRDGTKKLSDRNGAFVAGGMVMGCHRMDKDEACAGYVASKDGQNDIMVRIAYVVGALRTTEVAEVDGGLHSTLHEMRRAHGVDW